MKVTFQYLAAGTVWHTGDLETGHTSPQTFADELARIPLSRPTDEIRVWDGPVSGTPDAVAYRPLSTEGLPRCPGQEALR